jgi:hypothetical protein
MPGHFGIWYRPEQKLDDEINIRMGAMRAESNLLRSPLLQQPQLMQLLQPGMTLDTRIIQLPPLRDYSPGTQNINTGNIGIKIDNTTDNK